MGSLKKVSDQKREFDIKNNIINLNKVIEFLKCDFLDNPKESFEIMDYFTTKLLNSYDFYNENNLALELFINSNSEKKIKINDIKNTIHNFFTKTLLQVFKKVMSLKINDNLFLNLLVNDQYKIIFSNKKTINELFNIKTLSLPDFNYSEDEIFIIEKMFAMISDKLLISNKILALHIYDLVIVKNKKSINAIFVRSFLTKINGSLKKNNMRLESTNYKAIIRRIAYKSKLFLD